MISKDWDTRFKIENKQQTLSTSSYFVKEPVKQNIEPGNMSQKQRKQKEITMEMGKKKYS